MVEAGRKMAGGERDEDRSVGKVELLDHAAVTLGSDPEAAAPVPVEQRGEHARGVEAGAAEPVDCAVGGHECCRLQVTDQSMLGDRRVTKIRTSACVYFAF